MEHMNIMNKMENFENMRSVDSMENLDFYLDKYARLCVEIGINLKEDESLIINTNIHGLALSRKVLAMAYKLGARHVEIMFSDDEMTLARYNNAKESVFDNFPQWKIDALVSMYKTNYHHLFITAPDPQLLKSIDSSKVARDQKTASEMSVPAMQFRMTGMTKWCIVAVPSPSWAKLVFPNVPLNEAVLLLWKNIFSATRIFEKDPVLAWKEHDKKLKHYKAYLNEKQFEKLIFKAPGTDVEIYLADMHNWMGGSKESSVTGDLYVANIPTEEVFTTPHRLKVNGKVRATKPLSINGKIVEDFGFVFKDGKVIDYFARVGLDELDYLLKNDEGAMYLGEVALVSVDSPISMTGILFNNTLFDENASMHLALGRAYPYAMQEGTTLSEDELIKRGANFSIIHTDFMIGCDQMSVEGYEKDGTKTLLIKNGLWLI